MPEVGWPPPQLPEEVLRSIRIALNKVRKNMDPVWYRAAFRAGLTLAKTGKPFISYDFWKILGREGEPDPHEKRALGAVVRDLHRMGVIEKVYVNGVPLFWPNPSPTRHGTNVPVWKGVTAL